MDAWLTSPSLWLVFAFLGCIGLVVRFVLKTLVEMVRDYQKKIENDFTQAETLLKEAKKFLQTVQEKEAQYKDKEQKLQEWNDQILKELKEKHTLDLKKMSERQEHLLKTHIDSLHREAHKELLEAVGQKLFDQLKDQKPMPPSPELVKEVMNKLKIYTQQPPHTHS